MKKRQRKVIQLLFQCNALLLICAISKEQFSGPSQYWSNRACAGSPGGRRKPDLLVWSLFVDDVGAVVPAYLDGQHTALCTNKTENVNINPDLYMDTGV